jgi:hypothetical protein
LGHFSNTPHVCFAADFASGTNAGNELTRILESHLRDRYGSVRQVGIRIRGSLLHVLHVGRKEIAVVWYGSRFKDGEWIVVVGRYDLPRPLDRLRGRQSIDYSEELKLVSRGIHALLAATPGIARIRWYFKGIFGPSGKTVLTPDELSWAEPR